MSKILYEKYKLSSFDRSYTTEVYLKNPDRYRQLEKDSLKAENSTWCKEQLNILEKKSP